MEGVIFNRVVEFVEKVEVFQELHSRKNYKDLSFSEVHCIEKIEDLSVPNITMISKAMNMTKGGITKITTKLQKKGYIEKYRLEGNKKEVHFKLTPFGRELYITHEELHRKARKDEERFFSTFSEGDQRVIADFLERMNNYTGEKIKELEDRE